MQDIVSINCRLTMRLSKLLCKLWIVVKLLLSFCICVGAFEPISPAKLDASAGTYKMAGSSFDQEAMRTIRILALHGSGGNALEFKERLDSWWNALSKENIEVSITPLDAPFPKGDDGFSWWTMPPRVRSFNAKFYEGFDSSERIVMDALEQAQKPFDLVIAHSQGAILTSSLLALRKISGNQHPRLGYILNGVAWPNPYSEELLSLDLSGEKEEGQIVPRILFITGIRDKINPPSTAEKVQKCFQEAGMDVSVVTHDGGHAVPSKVDDSLNTIINWIMNQYRPKNALR